MELQFDKARWQTDSEGVWLCVRALIPRKAMNMCGEIKPDNQLYITSINVTGSLVLDGKWQITAGNNNLSIQWVG